MKAKSSKDQNLICRAGIYYLVKQVDGKTIYRSLKTRDKSVAAARGRALLKQLATGDTEWHPRKQSVSTIGELLAVYRAESTRVHATPKTALSNISCLMTIVATRYPYLASRPASELYAAVESMPLTAIDRPLIKQFFDHTMGQAYTHTDRESAKRRIKSHHRHAKSIFTHWVLESYRDHGIIVPPCVHEFTAYRPPIKLEKEKYLLPDPQLVQRTVIAGRALADKNPALYLVFSLAYDLGMRAKEIAAAEKDWITTSHTGQTVMRLCTRPGFRTKSGESRDIPIDPAVHTVLLELFMQFPGPHILPGVTKSQRYNLITRAFSSWMRTLGWDRQHAAHELRALAGSRWFTEISPPAAQKLLGHEKLSTTCEFYADLMGEPQALPMDTTGDFKIIPTAIFQKLAAEIGEEKARKILS